MTFEPLLARRTRRMGANAIREILKVVSRPGMISLAGGIPSPESFPMSRIETLTRVVIEKYGAHALQYDPTEGFPPLRKALSGRLAGRGIQVDPDEIYVTTGSQGVLDALGKVLIDPGDRVAVEAPTYLGALSAFNPYEPEYVRLDTDDQGVVPSSLDRVLARGGVKFIYLVPTFQNPTGRTLPLERRMEIARILREHGALLVEDDPYSDLRYRGREVPPICTLAPDHVVYAGTLSKVFAPGLRVGFFTAPEPIDRWMVLVKQGVDLHTGTFAQALAAEYLTGGHLEAHLPEIIDLYRPRLDAMLEALNRWFPDSFRWSRPEGGMFIWVEGPAGTDTLALYRRAVERKVAFVPGRFFFADKGEGWETMRLNFTMTGEAEIENAIRVLSEVIRDAAAEGSAPPQ